MTKNENDENESSAVATETPVAVESDHSEIARVRREIDEAVAASAPRDEKAEPEDDEEEPSGDSEVGSGEPSEDAAEKPSDPSPEGDSQDAVVQGRDAKGQFTPKAFSDALLERAIKSGIPMSEAREYPSESLLKSVVDRLEGLGKGSDGESKTADAKRKDGEAKPADTDLDAELDAIPDEWDEDYDPKLVGVIASLKKIAKAQAAANRSQATELAELRGKESKDSFAKQLESVKDFTKGDQTKVSAIRAKYDLLKAGATASGQDVSDDELFNDAAQLVLGSDFKAAAEAEAKQKKTEAAGRRSAQLVSRAAGQRVTSKTTDVFARVAEEIDLKLASRSR